MQNSQKRRAQFANHARRICNFLVHNSDVPSLEDYVAEGGDLQAEVIDGHYMSCLVNHAGGKDLYVILF